MNILITAGGTKEFIDGVRYIGNSSTGRTSAQMTDYLVSCGHNVTWLGAKSAIKPSAKCQMHFFETFEEIKLSLEQLLSENAFDLVFHAAAVSDFKVTSIVLNNTTLTAGRDCKIPTADQARINLEKTPKLIDSIKSWSVNKGVKLVGFKLTNSSSQNAVKKAVEKLLSGNQVDFIAHNNLPEITASTHSFNLHLKSGAMHHCDSPKMMCAKVIKMMEKAA